MEFDQVRDEGVIVVVVPGLRVRVALDEDLGVAMIRAGQTPTARLWCATWLMHELSPLGAPRSASSRAS